MKNILVICHTFPPAPGIGGRRWAKFTKYLCAEGYTVHVICAQNPFNEISPYSNDVKNPNLRIYPLPLKYPRVLITGAKTIFDRIQYKFYSTILKRIIKGNQFDKGVFWKKQLLQTSDELIKEFDIKNVIVTGAPFSLLYHAMELKKTHPDLNLIGDIRDPWTWLGCYRMSEKRNAAEKIREKSVLEKYDTIFVPVLPMLEYLHNAYATYSDKIKLLPHAFDPDEAPSQAKKAEKGQKEIKILFYGTMYDNSDTDINFLCGILKNNPEITLNIYTQTLAYKKIFSGHKLLDSRVFYHSPIDPAALMGKVKESDFILMIHPLNEGSQGISTKFYEIINQKVPILFIGYDQQTEDLLHNNQLGLCINHTKPFNIDQLKNFVYNSNYDVSNYSFQYVTRNNLINHLK